MKKSLTLKIVISALIANMGFAAQAADVVTDTSIGMELARDIANEAVMACRKKGYHIAAVVVDRHAIGSHL